MLKRLNAGLFSLCMLLTTIASAQEVDIPYTRYVLDNGLTLIVHEDHKAPIVAVNVWYHVGSKNEKPGKTGFAHLFEHLMFNGSENWNDEYFKPFDAVGATDMNGTTNFDRTNYFQNVPSNALDLALWMESDRMGHLLGVIDQERLDEQRGVVQNEKRQGDNQPYGRVFERMVKTMFPAAHPYSWLPIGSLEDLNAASLEDVQDWFRQYYGAANAVIVVAGDVNPDEVRERVEHYFGDIESGPPLARHAAWVPEMTSVQREVMKDRVPQARLYMVWTMPQVGDPDGDYMNLVNNVLTGGKTSRLYKRLVYDEQIATDITSFAFQAEISGLLAIQATAQPGGDLAALEAAINDELANFLENGPTRDELERAKMQIRSGFIRGIERIGGFGGKSDILAQGEIYQGNPDAYKAFLDRTAGAKRDDLTRVARDFITDGRYILEVHPFGDFKVAKSDVDRSELPNVGDFPEPAFEAFEAGKLDNGLGLIVARRDAVPVVNFNLVVDAGYAADQFGKPGTANLAMDMMDEGTESRNSLEINENLVRLGAQLSTGSNLDTSFVSLSALKENLGESLDIFADVVLNPAFPESDFERLRKQQIAGIQREQSTPVSMALRIFPKLLYGEGHAYGNPLTGSGTLDAVRAMSTDDLEQFHTTWFKPNNATLVVVGDTTFDEMKPMIERLFRRWSAGDVPSKNLAQVADSESAQVYLIDRPDSEQSIIFAGHVMPPKSSADDIAIDAMNEVLGGSFNARMNMNLREDKHWSYGARTIIIDAEGQQPFFAYAPVQTDKTKESIAEVKRELVDITEDRPPSEEEVVRAKDKKTKTLPGNWETANAVMGSLVEMVRFGLPADYWESYPEKVTALDVETVSRMAEEYVKPENTVWVVVGDRAKIEDGIRELELGELQVIDSEGNAAGE